MRVSFLRVLKPPSRPTGGNGRLRAFGCFFLSKEGFVFVFNRAVKRVNRRPTGGAKKRVLMQSVVLGYCPAVFVWRVASREPLPYRSASQLRVSVAPVLRRVAAAFRIAAHPGRVRRGLPSAGIPSAACRWIR